MSLSYDHSETPKDLRQFQDYEIERMQNGVAGLASAALAEVIRLRKLVKKLQSPRGLDSLPVVPP